jgi:hypothetical protein
MKVKLDYHISLEPRIWMRIRTKQLYVALQDIHGRKTLPIYVEGMTYRMNGPDVVWLDRSANYRYLLSFFLSLYYYLGPGRAFISSQSLNTKSGQE